jgi:S1-C subfamily serine protease
MTTVRSALLGVSLCLLLPCAASAAQATPGAAVYRAAVRGTVLVLVEKGSGSGWVVDRSRKWVVTNYHVVGEQKTVKVVFPRLSNGQVVQDPSAYRKIPFVSARVVRINKESDLALLELPSLPAQVRPLKLAKQEPPPGDRVHAIGNPGLSDAFWVYTAGEVRSVYRKNWKVELPSKDLLNFSSRIIETQAPSNAGDSGGPLLNDQAEVVGVQQGASAQARLISYAISVAEVKSFLQSARQAQEAQVARKAKANTNVD